MGTNLAPPQNQHTRKADPLHLHMLDPAGLSAII